MPEAEIRAAVLREAISWEGTPYHHHARLKGVGVDCAQLPAAVYEAAGAIPHLEPQYSSQWMLHRDEELYLEEIRRFAREIPFEAAKPADLIVWKFGRTYSHSAIILDPPICIHAVIKGGAVIRADYERDEDLRSRPRLAFSIFAPNGELFYRGGEG
jgi:cell wall-associated NlpC family hydrolase